MTSPPAHAGQRLDIRKYPNRRYYDSTRSRHVTLEEIHNLIRDGYEVAVTDSRTGRDITAKVLAQIILELDPPKLDIFPVPLLHRLIRTNEQLVNDFVEKYFNQALAAFLDSQRNFEQSLRQAMGLHAPPGLPDLARLMFGPLAPPFWAGARGAEPAGPAGAPPGPGAGAASAPPTGAGAAPAEPDAAAEGDGLRGVVDELRQQVAALQRELAEAKPRPQRTGAKRRRR